MTTDASLWGTGANVEVEVQVPGPPGPPPTLVNGETTSTINEPSVDLTLIAPGTYRLDFHLKQGDPGRKGDNGSPGTVVQATAEMVAHTESASVSVSGIPPNQSMHFKIPRQAPTPGVPGAPGRLQDVESVSVQAGDISLYTFTDNPVVLLNVLRASTTIIPSINAGVITLHQSISEVQHVSAVIQDLLANEPGKVLFQKRKVVSAEDWDVVSVDNYKVTTEKFVKVVAKLNLEHLGTQPVVCSVVVNDQQLELPVTIKTTSDEVFIASPAIKVKTDDLVQILVSSEESVSILPDSYMAVQRYF